MNFISWNIRGLGSASKGNWIKNLKVANEVGFLMIQETQFQSFGGVDVSRLWGSRDFDYDVVDAVGRSGGLLSVWDSKIFTKTSVIKRRYILVVSGYLKNDGQKVSLVNVYCPQKLVDKRMVWDEIKAMISDVDEMWIVAGDFNCVRDRLERRNSKFHEGSTKEFNDLLDESGLQEYSLRGRRFTFLSVLDKVESDHFPLLLKIESKNFGAKPFRFYNSWLNREGLDKVVEDSLNIGSLEGPADIILMSKFKMLRNNIKNWHKELTALEKEEEHGLRADIGVLEEALESRELTKAEVWVLEEANKRLRELEVYKTRDLKQKARVKWAKEGDANSSFFHGVINSRRVSNSIPGLVINGEWVTKPQAIKREVYRFFKDKFVEEIKFRPGLIVHDIKTLDPVEADGLVAPFLEKEIKEAVWDCGSDKAPGPDGFNFRFIKKYWPLLSGDLCRFLKNFQRRELLVGERDPRSLRWCQKQRTRWI
ncbi:putative RNA-directed DNA polymerase [Helianthus annuus]|nr:putative RNA-directed DNA polymerase [Helianthus annuus]